MLALRWKLTIALRPAGPAVGRQESIQRRATISSVAPALAGLPGVMSASPVRSSGSRRHVCIVFVLLLLARRS